jgi:hypothetical protein
VMEQFGYFVGIQQCKICKDHISFLQGGNWCWPVPKCH